MRLSVLLLAVGIAFFTGCRSTPPEMPFFPDPNALAGTPFTGRVVHVDLEGGFYGVVTDHGEQLNGDIPASLQQDGLLVKGRYEPTTDMGIHMWGRNVSFLSIQEMQQVLPGADGAIARAGGRSGTRRQ